MSAMTVEQERAEEDRLRNKFGVKSTVTQLATKVGGGKTRHTEEPAEVAESKSMAAEESAILSNMDEKAENVVDKAKLSTKYSQALVRGQSKFRAATDPDKKVEASERALADGVRAIENADAAAYALKATAKDVLTRLHHTFGYDRMRLRQLIKERRVPKGQLELDLKTERTELDKLHVTCEKMGAPRVEDQKVTKRKAA